MPRAVSMAKSRRAVFAETPHLRWRLPALT
jgi:hypothetical protein